MVILAALMLALVPLPRGPHVAVEEAGPDWRIWRPAGHGHRAAVLFVGGLASPVQLNAGYCEWLATHGYVTAAFATKAPARFEQASVDVQLAEISTMVRRLRQRRDVDDHKIALAAWSFGGVAMMLAAQQDQRIRALLSFDAAIGYDYGFRLLTEHPAFDAKKTERAALWHVADSFSTRVVAKEFRYLRHLHRGRVVLRELPALKHAEFVSAQAGDNPAYLELCEWSRQFLDEIMLPAANRRRRSAQYPVASVRVPSPRS